MNWRTDKPTADVIVVYLKGSCYPQVLVYDKDKQSYYEEHGAFVNMQDIVKWTPFLEEDEGTICPQRDETVTDCDDLEEAASVFANTYVGDNDTTDIYNFVQRTFCCGAKWGAEHTFTHHETDESLQEAVTHQMEDDQTIDDYVRKGLDEVCLRYAELGAKWGTEHRDRFLNWIRDLIKAGIEKPEEALNILKRIDALINDDSLWGEHLKK